MDYIYHIVQINIEGEYMLCQKCNEVTEEGKFCTSCGAELITDDSAATIEPTVTTSDTTETVPVQSEQTEQESNEHAEKLKDISSDFGNFFVTLVKKPGEARNADQNTLISSIIVIAIFSILAALSGYISVSNYNDIFGTASFADDFLIPMLKYIILFALIPVVTFAASKVSAQEVSLPTIIGKYGSYLVPFLLLFVVGIIFSLIKLGFPFSAVTNISLIGPVLIIPILIILEKPVKVFDRVYVLIVLSLVSFIIYGYLVSGLSGVLGRFGF
jgi:hypothetical protein